MHLTKKPAVDPRPNFPIVKFQYSREQVDFDVELQRVIQNNGWDCGTYFYVQFLKVENDKKFALLESALFIVTHVDEGIYTNEANSYAPMTKTVYTHKAERVGDWWTPGGTEKVSEKPAKDAIPAAKPQVIPNHENGTYDVVLNGKVIYRNKDESKAQDVADGKKDAA